MSQDTKITLAQERFIFEILKGKSQTEAYKIAYPSARKWKDTSVQVMASKTIAKPAVKKKYEELLEEFREKEKEKIGWSREQSIETLRFVIDTNKKDLERIQKAAEDELLQLQKDIEENPENARQIIQKMLNNRKRTRANTTNNSALISATSELNRMQGYNEQNINMSGTVIFQDEDLEE